MNYKDNIEWLKSLKQQIGKAQHHDLWHFEQVIDETIENLKPLAKSHGDLIDKQKLLEQVGYGSYSEMKVPLSTLMSAPVVIEAEQGDG